MYSSLFFCAIAIRIVYIYIRSGGQITRNESTHTYISDSLSIAEEILIDESRFLKSADRTGSPHFFLFFFAVAKKDTVYVCIAERKSHTSKTRRAYEDLSDLLHWMKRFRKITFNHLSCFTR